MADHSAADTVNTEALYHQVMDLVVEALAHPDRFNLDDLRRALDPILAMGKIIGRRDALKGRQRMPVEGEIWHYKESPEDTFEITYTHPDGPVVYRRDEFSGHHVSMAAFLSNCAPTTPAHDRLIEDWTKIVEADIR